MAPVAKITTPQPKARMITVTTLPPSTVMSPREPMMKPAALSGLIVVDAVTLALHSKSPMPRR
jgi:hypothetical protein